MKSSGKAMMLIDESAPLEHSINSEINPEDKRVIYTSFLQLCKLLKRIGRKGWIWVIDAVDAYYRIPIQEKFYHLFGVIWLNRLLIYKCLSFGLSTAPSIYNKFADLLLWACTFWKKKLFLHKSSGKFNILHYLDDFFGGHNSKNVCTLQKSFLFDLMELLNIPTNPSKVVGPSQKADILGWTCVTNPTIRIGVTEPKRIKYLAFITNILMAKHASFIQLEKVVGYTRHTCNVYLIGNKFIRGFERFKFLIEYLIKNNEKITKYTQFELTKEATFDLEVWKNLLSDAKRKYVDIDFILQDNKEQHINVWTDASTTYGAGGHSSIGNLYHLPWSSLKLNSKNKFLHRYKYEIKDHIIYLELLAVIIMTYLYAKNWKNKFINFYCDNATVVKALNSGTLKFSSKLYFPKANLLKLFARLALKHQFYFKAIHIEGKKNPIADSLSRDNEINRHCIYQTFNKSYCIPYKIASNIVNRSCVDKFANKISI